MFRCPQCPSRFAQSKVESHARRHLCYYPWSCRLCDLLFATFDDAQLHQTFSDHEPAIVENVKDELERQCRDLVKTILALPDNEPPKIGLPDGQERSSSTKRNAVILELPVDQPHKAAVDSGHGQERRGSPNMDAGQARTDKTSSNPLIMKTAVNSGLTNGKGRRNLKKLDSEMLTIDENDEMSSKPLMEPTLGYQVLMVEDSLETTVDSRLTDCQERRTSTKLDSGMVTIDGTTSTSIDDSAQSQEMPKLSAELMVPLPSSKLPKEIGYFGETKDSVLEIIDSTQPVPSEVKKPEIHAEPGMTELSDTLYEEDEVVLPSFDSYPGRKKNKNVLPLPTCIIEGKTTECRMCFKPVDLFKLPNHVLVHLKEPTWACHHCGWGSDTWDPMRWHLAGKHMETGGKLRTGIWRPELSGRMTEMGATCFPGLQLSRATLTRKSLTCLVCDKAVVLYTGLETLRRHMMQHLEEDLYECRLCLATFREKNSTMHRHMKLLHGATCTTRTCRARPEVLKSLAALMTRSRELGVLQRAPPERTACGECGMRINNVNGNRTKHVASRHMDELCFQCRQCGYQSMSETEIEKHAAKHRLRTIRSSPIPHYLLFRARTAIVRRLFGDQSVDE